MHPSSSLVRGVVCILVISCANLSTHAFAPAQSTAGHRHRQFHLLAMTSSSPSSTAPASNLEQLKSRISRAISIGAPAYNAGDVKGCADTYAETAQNIANDLPGHLRTKLKECLEEVEDGKTNANDDARAWALRRQFDAIMEYTPPFLPVSADSRVVLEPFTAQQLPSQPIEVKDNVMGGISSGSWTPSSSSETRSVGSFVGNTSLTNNGGFASLRWRFPTVQNFSYARGIYLKARHSNPGEHTFRLILKDATCERIRLANFKTVFANPSSELDSTLLIPFDEVGNMEQMGNSMVGAPSFDSSAVTEIGVMAIKPTVVGEFEIEILDWGLYN